MSREMMEELRSLKYPEYIKFKKNKCDGCGMPAGQYDSEGFLIRKNKGGLTVYHIDGDLNNNTKGNLDTLCRKCYKERYKARKLSTL